MGIPADADTEATVLQKCSRFFFSLPHVNLRGTGWNQVSCELQALPLFSLPFLIVTCATGVFLFFCFSIAGRAIRRQGSSRSAGNMMQQ